MSVRTQYTLTEAREMLKLWKACEKALAEGQVKEYRIGTREYTALNLPEITARITHFANVVDSKTGAVRTSGVARVVPRDL